MPKIAFQRNRRESSGFSFDRLRVHAAILTGNQTCAATIGAILFHTQIQTDPLVQWLMAAEVTRVSLPRLSDSASQEKLIKQLSSVPSLEAADFVRTMNAQGERHYETIELKK